MKMINEFKEVRISNTATLKIVGGTGDNIHNEDVPVTTLGTVTHDDDI